MTIRLVFHILAICGAATFAGAMLNIGLSFGAYWKRLPPAEFLDWFGANGWLIGRTIPLFVVPTFIGLAGALWLDWNAPVARGLWLASLAAMIGIGVITFAWHIPTNNAFAAKSIALADIRATLDLWLQLHAVRILLGLASAVLGVVAISR
ncbi:DUF1772 domain-containing protein [Phreatobacter stygius]|uniref:DUF1772 domain-containing protein n=1 Tax=Phreatobacter stygius TaxID=1940610 RepID=A0A4D7B971_9HYPH|nr:DUF1772 domain-containing protein [Phreatobacter stygius]QCI67343.1 DUF1772 domain-containing protein [Phreatobacter stygius]